MVGDLFAGVTAFKAAFDIANSLRSIDDSVKRNAAVSDLQQTILDGQRSQQELLSESAALRRRVEELESWEAERRDYIQFQSSPDVYTYVHKNSLERDDETQPQLCPNCFHSKFKSFLISETWNPGRCHMLVCRGCGWYAYLIGSAEPEHQKLAPRPYAGSPR